MYLRWNVSLILLIYSTLVADGLTSKKKKNTDDSVNNVLVEIRNYLEHLPSTTALSERISVLESLTKLNKEKTDTFEKALGDKTGELVKLNERTKFLEDRIGADADWRLEMAGKVAQVKSALEKKSDVDQDSLQTKEMKDMEARMKLLEEKEVSQNLKLMSLEQQIKEKDEELGVLRSEMAVAQTRMGVLEERENNTEEVLESVKDIVSALRAWHEVHQDDLVLMEHSTT